MPVACQSRDLARPQARIPVRVTKKARAHRKRVRRSVKQNYIRLTPSSGKKAAATWKFPCGCCFLLLGLDFFGFLGLVCCNKRKEENTMTIEKANKDFNQLIEQNGFINTGAKTPTGCEVYSREWNRKVQIVWYGESTDTLAVKIWISYG